VIVDSYNLELKYRRKFVGDHANKSLLKTLLQKWRNVARRFGPDPFGDKPSEEIRKKDLDAALMSGDSVAASIVHAIIEDFAQALAFVIGRFLKHKDWRRTELIVVGGGLRDSRIGELIIARAALLLNTEGRPVDMRPIHAHPDDAGLLGAVYLAPAWLLSGHDGFLAVDIGGTKVRVGLVRLKSRGEGDFSKSRVWKREDWLHADVPAGRDALFRSLIRAMKKLLKQGRAEGLRMAPFIGVACPGRIAPDGSILRGTQNLPGNWQSTQFNLPAWLKEAIPTIGKNETFVIMHNDAVVQGLTEIPFAAKHRHWGVLTIGTGLGNARFTTRDAVPDTTRRSR
jgi:predicted NBD/HSP70 family sugar kinase